MVSFCATFHQDGHDFGTILTSACCWCPLCWRHVGAADQPVLLPLTSSLYVKGKLADTEKVLVNVGTDYFVEVRPAASILANKYT